MTTTDSTFDNSSLKEQIDSWSARNAASFPPEVLQVFAAKTEEVLKSGITEKCISQGQSVPDFELPDSDGKKIRLSERTTSGPAILSFYRGAWCPYCTLEFQALLESVPRFKNSGASVLAISPQVANRFDNPAVAGFEDLCDESNQVARRFGLVYPLGDEIKKIYHRFGVRLEDLNGDDSYEVPIPATYIVDQNLKVHYVHASPELTERAEPETLLQSLAELN